MWQLAHANPQTMAELSKSDLLGDWQYETYAAEILEIIKEG
jgi:hypothetical protein